MQGYKVLADENANPGNYGFKIVHDREAPHSFSLQEPGLVRDWMKALMKATISRDYSSESITRMATASGYSHLPSVLPPLHQLPSSRHATFRR